MKKTIFTIALVSLMFIPILTLALMPPLKENKRAEKRENIQANQVQRKTDSEVRKADIEAAREEKMKLRQELKEKLTEEKCQRIEERINKKVSLFEEKKKSHLAAYENLKNRISQFITNAEEEGYDVTKLKADLAILKEKINTFTQDYATYISKLKGSKNYTCGHSEGDFKGELVEARALLKIVHEDAQEIREYFQLTVKDDVKAMKNQTIDKTEE
ncbi:MAG: hypothetical protein COU40_02425 [Candidatus Moranbacteria bacterium CG10_big_fil_rev_8_21_14_0_10_35_21]|nr:MAG: hypothetical protein COU40_02425 [Candidatus Moranbacteria bacterium CG10_big_fil_rev_8_21_14_0_10_35_21]PJA88912.1 MAG: hypothetical protein CO139_00585 [Candidatus Moranbacteria bacterium CG_4_9_14_3_um_filter_36_9]